MRRVSAKRSMKSARRGITIIEVMIVVTGTTLLLGLCAVSIQLLMKLNADVQGRYAEAVALERLGGQLRTDAHASETAQLVAEEKEKATAKPAGLRLTLQAGHIVEFGRGDGGVVRTESRAGKTVRHERFTLARGADRAVRASRRGVAAAGRSRHHAAIGQEPGRPAAAARAGGASGQGPPGITREARE